MTAPITARTTRQALSDHSRFVRIGFAAIAISFGAFGLFAATAPIDSAAVAPGQVAADTNKKPIQHLEGGIVREILVREAERVVEGQVLFRLEPTHARANVELLRKQFDAALALEARLVAEQAQHRQIDWPAELRTRHGNPAVALVLLDQQRQFDERRRSLAGQVEILKARAEQCQRDVAGKTAHASALQHQLTSLEQEYAAVTPLSLKGLYPVNKRLAMERDLIRIKGELGQVQADIERAREMIRETSLQIELVTQKFQEEVAQNLAETRLKISDVREKLSSAEEVLTRVDIRAPRSGIIQGLKVFAAGSVIKPGESIAELVPVEDSLIIQARVSPYDIDSVTRGRKAMVRFPSFSSRTTSALVGRVDSISADSMIDEVSKQPYYLARVVIDFSAIPRPLAERIVSGMTADVLIATGERTLLGYLVGPLVDSFAKGMREK